MNEIALSNNLSQIELEIKHHQKLAGESPTVRELEDVRRRLKLKQKELIALEKNEWLKAL